VPLSEDLHGSHLTQYDLAETYVHAKFIDPSNRLATIHQRHRQDRLLDRQTDGAKTVR